MIDKNRKQKNPTHRDRCNQLKKKRKNHIINLWVFLMVGWNIKCRLCSTGRKLIVKACGKDSLKYRVLG